MNQKNVSSTVIRRLPRYYRYLTSLKDLGISSISSKELAKRMNITASQVKQDFAAFGWHGLQGYGYDVSFLHTEIGRILGLDTVRNMIIIGAGSLGHALARHAEFEKKGFKIIGIFDTRSELVGQKVNDLEIMHFDNIEEFLAHNKVDIAALTVPASHAKGVVEYITKLGIKAIWNFVPMKLQTDEDVTIENIHLIDSLLVLGYKIKENANIKDD
ncbi:MAG: redox-sensing transcriptional repressor Rex [Peptococcaceae bacterium]|nr:redox-sensing transcriptional repressor Rex [Peptococcaceae bacterium]